MGIKEMISLVQFQIKTDKLLQIDTTDTNGKKTESGGTVRSITIDYNPKKAFALLGLYIGIVNANAPEIFLKIVQTMIGG